MEIRYTQPSDIPDLTIILEQTAVLTKNVLGAPLKNFLEGDTEDLWLTCEQGGTAVGFCYATPDQAVEGTWYMSGLAILPTFQRNSLGAELARQMEAELEEQSAQVMIVDLTDAPADAGEFFTRVGYTEDTPDRQFFKKALG